MPTAPSGLWNNLISSAGVFVITAGLIGTWVNQRVSPIEARIDALDHRGDGVEQKLSLQTQQIATLEAEHIAMQKDLESKLNTELFKTSREGLIKQIEDDKNNVIRVVEELSHQIHSLEEKIVSRAENLDHWNADAVKDEDFNKRLAEMTARINALAAAPVSAPPGPR